MSAYISSNIKNTLGGGGIYYMNRSLNIFLKSLKIVNSDFFFKNKGDMCLLADKMLVEFFHKPLKIVDNWYAK